MIAISASLLAADQSNLLKEVDSLPSSVTSLHLDIMDGVEVPNQGLVIDDIKQLPQSWTKEVHLMVVHPENFITQLQGVVVNCFFINLSVWAERLAWKIPPENIGLVINPNDDINASTQSIKEAKNLLVMGVIPGKSGQAMLPDTTARIQAIKRLNPSAKLTVDGGVNDKNTPELIQSGANQLVVGAYLFKATDRAKAVKNLIHSV